MSGNCGYDQLTEVYKRCNTSNLACGRLQCQSTKQNPIFGDPSTVYSVYNFITKDNRQEVQLDKYIDK
jgi:hypothetical protein